MDFISPISIYSSVMLSTLKCTNLFKRCFKIRS